MISEDSGYDMTIECNSRKLDLAAEFPRRLI